MNEKAIIVGAPALNGKSDPFNRRKHQRPRFTPSVKEVWEGRHAFTFDDKLKEETLA